jgi:hypothetical protein
VQQQRKNVSFYNSPKNIALLLKRCIFYESGTYYSVQFSVICLYPYTETGAVFTGHHFLRNLRTDPIS